MTKQITVALIWVWLLLSAFLLSVILAPFLLSEATLLSVSAIVQWPHQSQVTCSLCGMTRAFIALSQGHLNEAVHFNQRSVALYGLLLANILGAAIFLGSRIHKLRVSRLGSASRRNATYNP